MLKKKKVIITLTVIVVIAAVYGLTYIPHKIININPAEVSKIEIFDGQKGKLTTVGDKAAIEHIISNLSDVTFYKGKCSFGYMGYTYRLTIYKNNGGKYKELIINSSDTIRYNGFFYKDKKKSIDFDYLNKLLNKHQEADSNDNSKKDYLSIGFDLLDKELLFIFNNSLIDKDVVKRLGEPDEKSEAKVWGADGLEHQTWYYKSKGIELDLIRKDKNQEVNSINIMSPSDIKTSRNIGIGSAADDVLKEYEKEIEMEYYNKNPAEIVAGTTYGGAIFSIKNGKVSRIFIGAAAE